MPQRGWRESAFGAHSGSRWRRGVAMDESSEGDNMHRGMKWAIAGVVLGIAVGAGGASWGTSHGERADGDTACSEVGAEQERNKAVVLRYMQEVINGRDLDLLDEIMATDWIAHNPTEPNGREGLKAVFGGMFEQFPEIHTDVKRIIAEGDLVVVHSHYTARAEDRGNDWAPGSGAVADIFRLADGKIVEHWDVGQRPIPTESVNGNTMFDGGALYNYR